jgi:hypothetical protein
MKKFMLAITIILFAGVAHSGSVEATIVGPSVYTDSLWESVCISNKTSANPNYVATIIACPNDIAEPVPVACIAHSVSAAGLPPQAQAIVNYMITQWYNGTDPITGLPNSRYTP